MRALSNRSGVSWRGLLLLHGTLLLYATVGVFTKLASGALSLDQIPRAILFFGLALLVMLGYTVLWQQVLKRMPLSFAYSNKGVCTLWTCLMGLCFFGESMTWGKALGLAVVLVGVTLVVTDHE